MSPEGMKATLDAIDRCFDDAMQPRKRISGCGHQLPRQIEWITEGGCPICLTAESGIRGERLDALEAERRQHEQAAHEADMRTQAAVRSEKEALAETERLRAELALRGLEQTNAAGQNIVGGSIAKPSGPEDFAPSPAAPHWTDLALARLGYIRDKMKPEDVATVQDFLFAARGNAAPHAPPVRDGCLCPYCSPHSEPQVPGSASVGAADTGERCDSPPSAEPVDTVSRPARSEPDAYLVEFYELTKSGAKKHCTIASLEPREPTIFLDVDDDVESRQLIRATPLYVLESPPTQEK